MIRSAKGSALGRSRKGLALAALAAATPCWRCPPAARAAPPDADNGGGGGGAGDNSGYKIAMITHETPGDTFWDKIRAGAEQAAKTDHDELRRPTARPKQAG